MQTFGSVWKGSDELKKNWRKKRIYVWIAMFGILLGSAGWGIKEVRASIPDKIYVVGKDTEALQEIISNPWITTSDSVEASYNGKYTIECKLFDVFPVKQVTVSQAEPVRLAVCGNTVGIYMETDGVLVINTQEISSGEGRSLEPAKNLVQAGDYITKVDGEAIGKKDELVTLMADNGGKDVALEVRRDGETHSVMVEPVCAQDGSYKLGIWVRDNTQGIGTLTYVKEDGSYGALGHGISDSDMGELLKLKEGDLYNAQVVSITRGASGNPGELTGVIHYQDTDHLGGIGKNESCGIYGTIDQGCMEQLDLKWMEMGYKQDLSVGDAVILCSTDGNVEEYKVRIEEIYWDAEKTNKCFVLQVTDERLLSKTGGIVQGMSGAPIVQNGKMVGAVTHVFVNDPTRGYGIFAETMLETE